MNLYNIAQIGAGNEFLVNKFKSVSHSKRDDAKEKRKKKAAKTARKRNKR